MPPKPRPQAKAKSKPPRNKQVSKRNTGGMWDEEETKSHDDDMKSHLNLTQLSQTESNQTFDPLTMHRSEFVMNVRQQKRAILEQHLGNV